MFSEGASNKDIEKTREYYDCLSRLDLCGCSCCQNYVREAKSAYPEVVEYLFGMGADIEKPLCGPCSVYAESSLCEMLDDFVEEAQLVNRTARRALTAVLATMRWSIERCADFGRSGALIYRQNALWGPSSRCRGLEG